MFTVPIHSISYPYLKKQPFLKNISPRNSNDTLEFLSCLYHSPCNERTKKRQPDDLRLPEQIIIMSEMIYSNGLGRGVLSVEGGKMGKVNVG